MRFPVDDLDIIPVMRISVWTGALKQNQYKQTNDLRCTVMIGRGKSTNWSFIGLLSLQIKYCYLTHQLRVSSLSAYIGIIVNYNITLQAKLTNRASLFSKFWMSKVIQTEPTDIFTVAVISQKNVTNTHDLPKIKNP